MLTLQVCIFAHEFRIVPKQYQLSTFIIKNIKIKYSPQDVAKDYIAEHRVNQMFSSILSALMMHKPENPIDFIQNTLDEVNY